MNAELFFTPVSVDELVVADDEDEDDTNCVSQLVVLLLLNSISLLYRSYLCIYLFVI